MAQMQMDTRPTNDERSIGELFTKLANDTGKLVRQELSLTVAETRQNLRAIAGAAGWLGAGAVLVVLSILTFVGAAILLLSNWLPAWVSAALIGAVLAMAGAIIANQGWSRFTRTDITPGDSIASMKEDAEWLKEQIKN